MKFLMMPIELNKALELFFRSPNNGRRTFFFRAWVPTPRGFIDLEDKLRQVDNSISDTFEERKTHYSFSKIFKNSKEADSLIKREWNRFGVHRVQLEVEMPEHLRKESESCVNGEHCCWIQGSVRFKKMSTRRKKFQQVYRLIVFVVLPVLFIFACLYTLIILGQWPYIYFLGTTLFLLCYFANKIIIDIRETSVSTWQHHIENFDIRFLLEHNGLIYIAVTDKSLKHESEETKKRSLLNPEGQQVSRHAFHRMCNILHLHRHVFHDTDDDNLLMPQPVKSLSDKSWSEGFVSGWYRDAERSRMEGIDDERIGSIGAFEYVRVFHRTLANRKKDTKCSCFGYKELSDEMIKSERRILMRLVEYRKAKDAEKFYALEEEKKRVQQARNSLLGMVSVAFAAFVVLDLHDNSKIVIFPELSGVTEKILAFTAHMISLAGGNISLQSALEMFIFFILIAVIFFPMIIVWAFRNSIKGLRYLYCFFWFLEHIWSEKVCSDRYLEYKKRYRETEKVLEKYFKGFIFGNGSNASISKKDDRFEEKTLKKITPGLVMFLWFSSVIIIVLAIVYNLLCYSWNSAPLRAINGFFSPFDSSVSIIADRFFSRTPSLSENKSLDYLQRLSLRSKYNFFDILPIYDLSFVSEQLKSNAFTYDGVWHSSIIDRSIRGNYTYLTGIDGTLDISDSGQLAFPGLISIGKDLFVANHQSEGLQKRSEDTKVERGVAFGMPSLPSLETIGGDLIISNRINGTFKNLKLIDGTFRLSNSKDLFFPNLQVIHGDLIIMNVNGIDLEELHFVCGALDLRGISDAENTEYNINLKSLQSASSILISDSRTCENIPDVLKNNVTLYGKDGSIVKNACASSGK